MIRQDAAKHAHRHLDRAESKQLTPSQHLDAAKAYAYLAVAEELNRISEIISKRDKIPGHDRV